ncbi:hypothetical protein BH09PLA1_BH09PLA1_31170 [soil metagenome]
MSISLAAATTVAAIAAVTTTAATTAATAATTQPAPGDADLLLAAIVAAAVLTVAFFVGSFRRDSVLGPIRLHESDSPTRVLAIAFLGIGLWMGLAGMYLALVHGTEITAARQGGLEYSMPLRESAILNVCVQLIALVAVVRADQILLQNGLAKLGFTPRDFPRGFLAGLLGAIVAVPLTFAVSIFVTKLWFVLKFPSPQDHQLIRLLLEHPDRVARWLAIASPIVVAPLFEETIFRGHIQTLIAHSIRRFRGLARPFDPIEQSDAPWIRWIAICTSAALFAVIHEAGWMMPPLFVLAVCFGYVYERTGKLWAPIVMHALFNATSIALALFTRG